MAPRLGTMPDSSTRFLLCRMPPIAAAPRSPDGVSQSGGNGAPASTRSSAAAEFRAPALIGVEVIAVLAAFPAIGEIFAEMIVAAGHPIAEGAE